MRTILVTFTACAFLMVCASGEPESRIALLMGVARTGSDQFADLPGIGKDLSSMSEVLKQVGFEVTIVSDPSLAQAENAIDDFGVRLKSKRGIGLFYFSGHGGEYEGKNYLIPRGVRLGEVRDIKDQTVATQRVLNRMEASGSRVNIVFLDCCRNDMTKAGTNAGLAAMNSQGTFIGFATASEKTSAASTEGSPYTRFLVKNITTPGLSISDMHTLVTAEVQDFTKEAGAEQIPFSYSGLRSAFFFADHGPLFLKDLHYGANDQQVLDFYQAKSKKAAPLVFYIHGGGWIGGDKKDPPGLTAYLDAGISVASINYRFVDQAQANGVVPPVKAPMEDAARALQFVRSKAAEWNIDKERIGASGSSAGGCTGLWLAFHPDMADPNSKNPVTRESTRLWCVAAMVPQTTLDPKQMKEWIPNSGYGAHAFGIEADAKKHLSRFEVFYHQRGKILPWIAEYSPYALVTKDDPPVYLLFNNVPAIGQNQKDPTHSANFGVKLQEHCMEAGVPCELFYPGVPNAPHQNVTEYLIEKLKAPSTK